MEPIVIVLPFYVRLIINGITTTVLRMPIEDPNIMINAALKTGIGIEISVTPF